MPIQFTLTEDDGTQPTYHVVTGVMMSSLSGSAQVTVQSWMDQAHFASQVPCVAERNCDISPLLGQPAQQPSGNFGPQIISVIEQYLLTTATFTGGTQVS